MEEAVGELTAASAATESTVLASAAEELERLVAALVDVWSSEAVP